MIYPTLLPGDGIKDSIIFIYKDYFGTLYNCGIAKHYAKNSSFGNISTITTLQR